MTEAEVKLIEEKILALQLARLEIKSGRKGSICHALRSTRNTQPSLQGAVGLLILYISRALGHENSVLGEWQEKEGFGDRGGKQRRLDRLAWIDWIIVQYEEMLQPKAIEVPVLTKPSINWDHVHPDFNWLFESGKNTLGTPKGGILSTRKPYSVTYYDGVHGFGATGEIIGVKGFSSYAPGTCAPEDSLVCRPGYKGP